MQEIKDLTLQEVLNIDTAIKRVRDAKTATGATLPGCTFPFKIMYRNGKIEGQLESRVRSFTEAKQKKIDTLSVLRTSTDKKDTDEKGKFLKLPWLSPNNAKMIEKELTKELDIIEEDLVLMPYPLSLFLEMEEDEYYKEANKETPIPQEFFSLMGRMIYDDTNGEDKPEKAKKK